MDARQRTAEKEKVKDMLRDAIRILCQNTVSHRIKLSVEALIGITVDDDETAMIVNINETISDTVDETEEIWQNIEADESFADLGGQDMNAKHMQSYDDFSQQNQQSVPPYTMAVVKQETSVIRYNVGDHDNYQHAGDPYFAAGGGLYAGDEAPAGYGQPDAFSVPRGQHVMRPVSSRARGFVRGRPRGRGLARPHMQTMNNFSGMPLPKQEPDEGDDPTAASNYGNSARGRRKSAIDAGEVSHISLYTCQRCGKEFKNIASFRRHKKSHLGIIYRCDGCGKIVSRSDHLTAHRRKCALAQQQAPLD